MGETPKLYSAAEAGTLTNRSSLAVRNLARRHGFGQQAGTMWVFTDEDIDRLRAINKVGGRPRDDGTPRDYDYSVTHEGKRLRRPYQPKE
jgi:hypothetical protein